MKKIRLILEALIGVIIFRAFFFEITTVPTGSMERTIMIGDRVLISKIHYGTRITITPLQIPLTHQKIPFFNTKSFLTWIKLPYFRFPGLTKIKRNDIVVFNAPSEKNFPIDLKTFYIKRCLGLPGEKIKMIENNVYINNKKIDNAEKSICQYIISSNEPFSIECLKKYKIKDYYMINENTYIATLDKKQKKKLQNYNGLKIRLSPNEISNNDYISKCEIHENSLTWGEITIPCKGMKVVLNKKTVSLYGETIVDLDSDGEAKIQNGELYVGGKKKKEYIFRKNYYFMIGDNRTGSNDSRAWGFVPEDHICGKYIYSMGSLLFALLILITLILININEIRSLFKKNPSP